ncbi:MAG: large exoprotein involved in heme utilization and adhesion, partial [Cellvibrionaceae bacterium]
TADAGDIDLRVDNTIKLLANSRLSTKSASGGGGQIKVLVNDLLYLRDSAMTTSVEQSGGQGNGGDIFVDPIFIVLDNSVITANAIGGNGGNITLIADYINQSTDSQITASSELGVDGEINIDAFDAEVEAGENNLATDFLDASQWVQQACAQRSGSRVSSFILNQRPPRQSPYDDWSISQEL